MSSQEFNNRLILSFEPEFFGRIISLVKFMIHQHKEVLSGGIISVVASNIFFIEGKTSNFRPLTVPDPYKAQESGDSVYSVSPHINRREPFDRFKNITHT
jgi:hypothetical protein